MKHCPYGTLFLFGLALALITAAPSAAAPPEEPSSRSDRGRVALLKLLSNRDQPLLVRMAALIAVQPLWNDRVQTVFLRTLRDAEPSLRWLAADGLALYGKRGDEKIHGALLQSLGDTEPAVRRAVALAMGRIAADGSDDNLVNALAFDDGRNAFLREGLIRAIERLGKPGVERVLSLADSGAHKDLDTAVEAFLAMRTRAAAEGLPTLLKNVHLSAGQRADLIRSFARYQLDPPVSPQPILNSVISDAKAAPQVRQAALDLFGSTGQPPKEGQPREWLRDQLKHDESEVRQAAVRAVAATRLSKAVPRLTEMLNDSACPTAERTAIVRALRVFAAEPALREANVGADLKKYALQTDPKRSELLGLRLEALQTLAVLDAGLAHETARGLLEDKQPELVREAIIVLAGRSDGARVVGRAFLDGKLTREQLPHVRAALERHQVRDAEVADLLVEVLKRAGKE